MYTEPAAEAPVTLRTRDGRLLIAVLDPDTTSSPLRRALADLRDHTADHSGQGT